ncbi:hypothetical protein Sjap_005274 [Stephania japonica]|uniref:Uncharacterized protein n=1 Tax=Stephania japonica TaxID=461633 RepID=A0AAP0K3Y4_9MAGN
MPPISISPRGGGSTALRLRVHKEGAYRLNPTRFRLGSVRRVRVGGSKAGNGSTVTSHVEAAPSKRKRSTSSKRKKKVDHNNPIPKHKRVKHVNKSEVQPVETGVEYEGATSSISDRGVLTIGAGSREVT